jgi:hypothetical protein
MSEKALDKHGRWRSISVSFRASPSEVEQIHTAVKLSGLTKQEYIIRTLLDQDIHVTTNPRVYITLKDQMTSILNELQKNNNAAAVDPTIIDTINNLVRLMGEIKEGSQ